MRGPPEWAECCAPQVELVSTPGLLQALMEELRSETHMQDQVLET
jgi:hypothetical protein